MRSNLFLFLFCALTLCFYNVSAAPQLQVDRRQNDNTDRPASSTSGSTRSTPTTLQEVSSSTQSTSSSSPKETSTRGTVTSASSSALAITTTSNALSPTASNPPVRDTSHALPNKPKITPALGMAGVIFILSGGVYAVIGIKNRWLYVFTSAAYLASLAVTVLIVYLMTPPVSNAVQGAFFVAACFSGLIFGALSLVFSDITEGLGCLLGGFCLSMWLLTLKEGGLIASTGGRAILIGCISVAAYGLSFSRRTREYGLIGCISFSGSTIVILGIDCFSRAGLKEFWIYIWNLNPDVFPLHTNTYPMTRGIKAELAGQVILALFGIISQLQVWRLVKEHREKSATQQIERARDQELEEEERGRKVEDKFQEERAQWEATYNQKNLQDSSTEDSIRDEKSLHAKDGEVIQDQDDGTAQSLDKEPAVTINVLQDDEIEQIDAAGKPLPQRPDAVHLSSGRVSDVGSARTSLDHSQLSRITRESLKPSAPPPPVIIPLPFKVPQEEDAKSQASDNASISAVPDVEDDHEPQRQSPSKRISGISGGKRLSTHRLSSNHFKSEEAVRDFDIETDRASSVAATLDDDMSVRELSPPASPVPDDSVEEGNGAQTTQRDHEASTQSVSGNHTRETSLSETVAPSQSLTISTDPKLDRPLSKLAPLQSPNKVQTDADISPKQNNNESSRGSLGPEQIDSATGSLENLLPTEFSKVARAFRVNEWSKHLEAADKPDIEQIEEPESPGVKVDHERPAPVSEELTRPLSVQKRNSNRTSSANTVQNNTTFARSNSAASQYSQTRSSTLFRSSGTFTIGGVSRSGSQVHIRPLRNSSGHLEPLVEPPSRARSPAAPYPANTLMSQRETLMRNRASSQSLLPLSGAPTTTNNSAAPVPDEEMTLAQRKRALQHRNSHQKPPSASQKWQRNSRSINPITTNPNPTQMNVSNFDSHPPQRHRNSATDQKRESLLAGWRESIKQDAAHQPHNNSHAHQDVNAMSAALLSAKRQQEAESMQQAAMAQQRESMRINMMRSNEMLDAHREALRRMQGSANQRA